MDLGDVVWILTPIHVNGNLWGLLCLNMAQQQAFYDDGLKQSPPTNIIELADNLLKAVLETQWNIIFPTQQHMLPILGTSFEFFFLVRRTSVLRI